MKRILGITLALVTAWTIPAIGDSTKIRDCSRGIGMNIVPLVWSPTEQIASPKVVTLPKGTEATAGAAASAPIQIEVKALTDTRENQKRIGENREDVKRGCVYPVITKDDPTKWTTERLRYLLGQLGYRVVEQGGDVILSGELRQFFVTETGTYDGEIAFRLDATSKTGKPLWSGLVRGTNGHWGKSYKLANYHETLSDALIDAVENLTADSNFAAAVGPSSKVAVEKGATP